MIRRAEHWRCSRWIRKRRIESAQKSPRSEDVATTGGRRLTRTPSPLGFHAAPRRSTSRRRSSRALTLVPCAFVLLASSRFLSLPFTSPLPLFPFFPSPRASSSLLFLPWLFDRFPFFRFECVFRFEGFRFEGWEREKWRRVKEWGRNERNSCRESFFFFSLVSWIKTRRKRRRREKFFFWKKRKKKWKKKNERNMNATVVKRRWKKREILSSSLIYSSVKKKKKESGSRKMNEIRMQQLWKSFCFIFFSFLIPYWRVLLFVRSVFREN